MDAAGEHQLDVAHNVFKKRLNKDGTPVAVVKQESTVQHLEILFTFLLPLPIDRSPLHSSRREGPHG